MIGTATSKLFGFSSAAWPPRLKMPTLYPVFPKLRVGIAVNVRGLSGSAPSSLPVVACAGINSLFSLIRKDVDLSDVGVSGSDHLTGYNIVTAALRKFGSIEGSGGEVNYEFRGDYVNKSFDRKIGQQITEKGEFVEWCEAHGFNGKAIRETTLAMKSIYHQLGLQIPHALAFEKVEANHELARGFVKLLAGVGSLDFVHNEHNPEAGVVWTARHSVCRGQSDILGTIRFWTDRQRVRRATIEGTEIPVAWRRM